MKGFMVTTAERRRGLQRAREGGVGDLNHLGAIGTRALMAGSVLRNLEKLASIQLPNEKNTNSLGRPSVGFVRFSLP